MFFPVKYGLLIFSLISVHSQDQCRIEYTTCRSCSTFPKCRNLCSNECSTDPDNTVVVQVCRNCRSSKNCKCMILSSGEPTTSIDPHETSTVYYNQESNTDSSRTVVNGAVGTTVSAVIIICVLIVSMWYFKKKRSKNGAKSKPVSYGMNNVTYETTDEIHRTDANKNIGNMYANDDYTTLQGQHKPEIYADLCKTETECKELKNSDFLTNTSHLTMKCGTHVPQNRPNMSLERGENTTGKAVMDSNLDYTYIDVGEIQSNRKDEVDSSTDGVNTSGHDITTESKTMINAVQSNENNEKIKEPQYQMLIQTNKVSETHQYPDTNMCETKEDRSGMELENNRSRVVQNNSEYTSLQFEGTLSTAYDEVDETSRHSDSHRFPKQNELENRNEEDNDYDYAYTSVPTKEKTEQIKYEEPGDLSDAFQQNKSEMIDLRMLKNDDSYAELILENRESTDDTYNTLDRLPGTLPDDIAADYNTLIPNGEFDEESEEYSHLNRSVIVVENSTDSGYGKLEFP